MREVGYAGPMVAAADGEIIDGSARLEVSGSVFGSEVEPIVVDSDGTRPIVVVRTDIPNAKTRKAKRLATFANKTAEENLNWDLDEMKRAADEAPDIFKGILDDEAVANLIGKAEEIPETIFEQAVQLKPNREYIVVMCEQESEMDELKALLKLTHKRRGGYKRGSAFDAVGLERVVTARRLLDTVRAGAALPEG